MWDSKPWVRQITAVVKSEKMGCFRARLVEPVGRYFWIRRDLLGRLRGDSGELMA
jgi:hypothetical protein